MKALVLKDYNVLAYEETPTPHPSAEEVLIAVKACGICGSDVHGMDGSTGRRRPPVIMGHEAAGVIAGMGSSVEGWKVGDRVTFDSTIYCAECAFCRAGRINLCDRRRVLGVSCEEYRQDGAMADFVSVPQHILYRMPDRLPFEHAAMVEPFSIALHALRRTAPSLGHTVVVLGAGMIGLALVQALRAAGCGQIISVDVSASRLDLAARCGADCCVNPELADALTEIRRLTGGRGADIAFEAVGVTSTVRLALDCVRKGGGVTLVGNVTPNVEFALQVAVTRELTVCGSCASCGEYPACLDLLARGALRPEPLLSALAPLAEGAAWFDRLYRREPGLLKVVLVP